ncbi:amidohydrolase family protein [Alicyclobacillus sp. SO9]|uniref:amidohydrolase family protein n=1 Tax=Alicyclobacillus sp. SO9 TaxID=2665646 RepID=UPI0018E89355|nr:amidohydrolase family protein [Alicyclobacillus sp. SO9]QQE77944.1 amidohydrolase family protein [Alicyclobacillus sp. SO9]
MIIDVHAHLGYDRVYDDNFTEADQVQKISEYEIDVTILQPALVHTFEEVRQQHNDIYQLIQKSPDKFRGMANPNPHLPDEVYAREVKHCIENLGFVGIKIHTAAHGVHPGSRDGRKVFALAQELGVPVMIHTGAGIPFANPANILPIAQEFFDVSIVLAHSGMMVTAGETPIVLNQCENVYADITWTGGFLLKDWVLNIGAERFMFGTDHADNCGTELSKVRTCGLSSEDQDWILFKTAKKVYKL